MLAAIKEPYHRINLNTRPQGGEAHSESVVRAGRCHFEYCAE